jgi:quinol-cytochrome oxidoreductase complex cytochrome b subunit
MNVNSNDIIIGIAGCIVVLFVIFLGMGIRAPTEDTLPFIEETQQDMISAVFTKDVVSIVISLVIIAIVAVLIHIGKMYQGWDFGDK